MGIKWNTIIGSACFLTVALYLISVFYPIWLLKVAYSLLAAILLFSALPFVRKTSIIITIPLLVIGLVIFFQAEADATSFLLAFGYNINLLSLFLLVPLIGVFLSLAGFLTTLKVHIEQLEMEDNNKSHPYRLGFLLTATMGAVLNLGSMVLVHRIIEGSMANFFRKKMVMVLLRAFGFCMFWSPYFVNVGLVLVLFDVSWSSIGLYGLIIGMVYVLISLFYFPKLNFATDEIHLQPKELKKEVEQHLPPLRILFIFGAGLFLCSFILETLLPVNMLSVVSLLGFFYPLVWAIVSKQFREYTREFFAYVNQCFTRLKNEIVIFISAGFFGAALSLTEIGTQVSQTILTISQGYIYVMTLIVISFAIILSIFGIHPVVIVIGIGSALSPQLFLVSSEFMAILLLIAWTLATQVSPFSGSVLMASGLMNFSSIEIAKKNSQFVLVCMFVLAFFLYLFHWLKLI
ncbi:hypothetical protein [Alkalihalobacterium elongatum]|uniref:hypothetical protein n=1 Tax=Alkalihalobacterium elongatum TaxID=2675466 RepID=UPI001C1FF78C|nr:hypothetical protein [Alkalihalobacterium elongatum]